MFLNWDTILILLFYLVLAVICLVYVAKICLFAAFDPNDDLTDDDDDL